jgi:hypothetical protein
MKSAVDFLCERRLQPLRCEFKVFTLDVEPDPRHPTFEQQ